MYQLAKRVTSAAKVPLLWKKSKLCRGKNSHWCGRAGKEVSPAFSQNGIEGKVNPPTSPSHSKDCYIHNQLFQSTILPHERGGKRGGAQFCINWQNESPLQLRSLFFGRSPNSAEVRTPHLSRLANSPFSQNGIEGKVNPPTSPLSLQRLLHSQQAVPINNPSACESAAASEAGHNFVSIGKTSHLCS